MTNSIPNLPLEGSSILRYDWLYLQVWVWQLAPLLVLLLGRPQVWGKGWEADSLFLRQLRRLMEWW